MEKAENVLSEENTASRFLYHWWRNRLTDDNNERLLTHKLPFAKKNKGQGISSPVHEFQIDLPLPSGHWPIIFEEFPDGSWAVYFKDFPDIIAGSSDDLEEALECLTEIVIDELSDKKNISDNISPYQKRRYQFLKKVFGV